MAVTNSGWIYLILSTISSLLYNLQSVINILKRPSWKLLNRNKQGELHPMWAHVSPRANLVSYLPARDLNLFSLSLNWFRPACYATNHTKGNSLLLLLLVFLCV
nr:hypothetical protein [Gigaspora margarita]